MQINDGTNKGKQGWAPNANFEDAIALCAPVKAPFKCGVFQNECSTSDLSNTVGGVTQDPNVFLQQTSTANWPTVDVRLVNRAAGVTEFRSIDQAHLIDCTDVRQSGCIYTPVSYSQPSYTWVSSKITVHVDGVLQTGYPWLPAGNLYVGPGVIVPNGATITVAVDNSPADPYRTSRRIGQLKTGGSWDTLPSYSWVMNCASYGEFTAPVARGANAPCTEFPCGDGIACSQAPGKDAVFGRSCADCATGYRGPLYVATSGDTGGYGNCNNINECTEPTPPCDPLTLCTDATPGYICGDCPPYYSGTGYTGCTDINECTTSNGGCDSLTACFNQVGAPRTCGDCPGGYSTARDGSGATTCSDIDECLSSPCGSMRTCTNSVGSYSCSACPAGYEDGAGGACVNIDECVRFLPCDSDATCTDTTPGYYCTCNAGYEFAMDGVTCVDIEECLTNPCPNQQCIEMPGSYTCGACNPGYEFAMDGITCVNKDECAEVPSPCDPVQTCVDTEGSYDCGACPVGYDQPASDQCVDQDECVSSPCVQGCENFEGGYVCAPYLVDSTLALDGGSFAANPLLLADTEQGTRVQMNAVVFTGVVATNLRAFYTDDNALVLYECTGLTATAQGGDVFTLRCDVAEGVGQSLRFYLSFCTASGCGFVTTKGNDALSYPGPTILGNTLRKPSQMSGGDLIGLSQGMRLRFDGINFASTNMVVTFGPPGNTTRYSCTIDAAKSSTSTVECTSEAGADGKDNIFKVQHLAGPSTEGEDLYQFRGDAPVVSTVRGCGTPVGDGTDGCPTDGQATITITGTNFDNFESTVLVNGQSCPLIPAAQGGTSTQNVLECRVPASVGADRSVIVSALGQFSVPRNLVSYSPPTIDALASFTCRNTGPTTLALCERESSARGRMLTITGNNFGGSDAAVLIGSQACGSVTHVALKEHSQLTCVMPEASGVDLPVLVIQYNGKTNALGSAQLSFTACNPGSYEADLACPLCPAGKASSVPALGCSACHSGLYSENNGTRQCQRCLAGTYTPMGLDGGPGHTMCSPCNAGEFSAADAQPGCEKCPAGTFSAGGATMCTQCPKGKFQDKTGQSECVECTRGRYQSLRGRAQCLECAVGRFNNDTGAESCTECPQGRSQFRTASTDCESCPPGWFREETESATCLSCPAGKISSELEMATSCIACGVGKYQPDPAKTECLACPPGKYTSVAGQVECLPCAAGRFAEGENNAFCTDCTKGKFQASGGRDTCDPCPKGSITSLPAQVQCQLCPSGYVADSDGLELCSPCPAGRAQPSSGAATCNECTAGRFTSASGQALCAVCSTGTFSELPTPTACTACGPGSYTGTVESDRCVECPMGLFQASSYASGCEACPLGSRVANLNETGNTECVRCQPGFAQLRSGEDCQQCLPGTIAREEGAFVCEPCPKGYFSASNQSSTCTQCEPGKIQAEVGRSSCDTCAAGKFSLNNECLQCEPGRISGVGSTVCESCRMGVATTQGTACECTVGTFFDPVGEVCEDCPIGAVCNVTGLQSSTIPTAAGFWQQTDGERVRCLRPEHCNGGLRTEAEGSDATCGRNRQGPLCAECKPGFRQSLTNPECTLCESQGSSWLYSVLFGVGILAALCVLYAMVLRGGESADGIDMQDMVEDTGKVLLLSSEDVARPTFTYNLKILLSFLQICTAIVTFVEIPWPEYFLSFLAIFNFINLDFIPWNSVECLAQLDFYERFFIVTMVPLGLVGLFCLCWFLPLAVIDRVDMRDDEAARARRLKLKHNSIKLLIFTLFLIYPAVSKRVLSFFVCTEVEGVDYLVADIPRQCYDDRWTGFLPVALACVLIYPVGIPLCFYAVLMRIRARVREADVRAAYGFLFEAYHPNQWYFELVDMSHKLFLTGLVVFFPTSMQLPAAMTVSMAYTAILLWTRPFIRKADDRIQLLAQAELSLLLIAAYTLRDSGLTTTLNYALSIILIGILLVVMLLFAYHIVLFAKKMVWLRKRIKLRQNKQNWAEEEVGSDGGDSSERNSRGSRTSRGSMGKVSSHDKWRGNKSFGGQAEQAHRRSRTSQGTEMWGGSTAPPTPRDFDEDDDL